MLSCAEARSAYEALMDEEKWAAQTLAMRHEFVTKEELGGLLDDACSTGRSWKSTALNELVTGAVKRGWLVTTRDEHWDRTLYRCHDAVAHWAGREAVRSGRWSTPRSRSGRVDCRTLFYTENRRDAGGASAVDAFLAELRRMAIPGSFIPLMSIFGPDCPPELLDMLPLSEAMRLYHDIANNSVDNMRVLDVDVRNWFVAHAGDYPDLVPATIAGDLLAGRSEAAEELATLGGEATAMTARATAMLLRDDFAAARTLLAQLIEQLRATYPRRKPLLKGPLAPLLTALMVTDSRGAWNDWAHQQIAASKRRNDLGDMHAYHEIEALLRATERGEVQSRDAHVSTYRTSWLPLLLQALRHRWCKNAALDKIFSSLDELEQRARHGGMIWLANQFGLAASAGDVNSGLVAMHSGRPTWKLKLNTLADVLAEGGQDELSPIENRPRLAWFVSVHYGHIDLAARLQKKSKRGWTRGSLLTLQRLHAGRIDGARITDADRRVIAHLFVARTFSPQNAYVAFDETVALAIIGHPLLFGSSEDSSEPDKRLVALRAEPELSVTRDGERFSLSMSPSDLTTVYPRVKREGDKLLVYSLTDKQASLLQLIRSGPFSVPEEGLDELRALLTGITPHMRISSELEIDADSIATAPADNRLHALLWRADGGGVRLRLRMFPLGEQGPSFAPGEGAVHLLGSRDGDAIRVQRDLAGEEKLDRALRAACPTLAKADAEPSGDLMAHDTLDSLELMAELWRARDRVTVSWPDGDALRLLAERDVRDVKVMSAVRCPWLKVSAYVPGDADALISLRELIEGVTRGAGRFARLENGSYMALSRELKDSLERLRLLQRGPRDANGALILHPLAASVVGNWVDETSGTTMDRAMARRLERVREAATLMPPVPKVFQAELRDYQLEGFRWLARLAHWGAGACLADDMGLGKTIQVLAVLLRRGAEGPAMVVAPKSVVPNWAREAERFAPTLRVVDFAACPAKDRHAMLRDLGPGDLLLISYGLMTREINAISEQLFATVVMDEAQAIKNATTLRAKSARKINATFKVITTGTPVENQLGELWSLFAVLNPGLLGDSRDFADCFARPIQLKGDPHAARALKALVRPFILRRTKAEVLHELPERTEVLERVEPDSEERAFYEGLRQDIEARIKKRALAAKKDPNRIEILAALTRLRRAACNPKLVAPDATIASAKLQRAVELVEELRAGNHRALIFSQFVGHLKLVRDELEHRGISYQYLDGSTPMGARDRAVQAFQSGVGDVFLISLKAGGLGLNLTAADYVIHMDPWWNPAAEDQASDRIYRIGQKRPVTIYRLVTAGTIEELIIMMHEFKRDLATLLLEGHETAFTLDTDKLLALLETCPRTR